MIQAQETLQPVERGAELANRVTDEESEASESPSTSAPEFLRLSSKERMALLGQLAVLLESGIQIPAALRAMREQTENPRAGEVLAVLEDAVRSGHPLSEAVGDLPRAFPELVKQMVAAGESAGRLGEMIQRVTEMLEAEDELRGRVRSALLYPAVMLAVALAVVTFLLTVIVPKFGTLFLGKQHALPMPTQVLMCLGEFLSTHAIWLFPSLLLVLVASVLFLRSSRGQPHLDRALLHLPVISEVYRTAILSRTSRTLGMLTRSGVAILVALEHTREVAGSPAFARLWEQVHRVVANGGTINDAIRPSPLLPATFKQMVGSGEAAARLDLVLIKAADHYAGQLQRKVRDISTLIEPILVVMLGGVVGFIALSIMLPIFKLSRGI